MVSRKCTPHLSNTFSHLKVYVMLQQIRNFIQNRPKVVYVILDIPMFVVTFAFIVLTGHALEPEPLALFNSGLGIFTVLSTIGLAVQSVIARRIAAAKKIVGVRDFFLGTIIVGLLTIIPFLLPLPEMKSLDAAGISTMVLYLSAHMGISFCRGILQGTERFYALWALSTRTFGTVGLLIALMQGVVSIGAVWVVVVMAYTRCYGHAAPQKHMERYRINGPRRLTKEIFAVVMCNFLNTCYRWTSSLVEKSWAMQVVRMSRPTSLENSSILLAPRLPLLYCLGSLDVV